MSLREWLLIGHILFVVFMGFGSGAGLIASVVLGDNPDLMAVRRTAHIARIGGLVTTISAVIVLIFGTWLVFETPGYEFEQLWLTLAYVFWVIAMALGGAVMARHERTITERVDAALARGETTDAVIAADFASPMIWATGGVLVLLYPIFIYLMVAKPGY